MKLLLDQCIPIAAARAFIDEHDIECVYDRGWSTLSNLELLAATESAGFDVLVTTDWSADYQHIQKGRQLRVIGLSGTSWPRIDRAMPLIHAALWLLPPGAYIQVAVE
jgi:hypothetical protein